MKEHPERVIPALAGEAYRRAVEYLRGDKRDGLGARRQMAWTEYVILRLREGRSPGCDMRDLVAYYKQQEVLTL